MSRFVASGLERRCCFLAAYNTAHVLAIPGFELKGAVGSRCTGALDWSQKQGPPPAKHYSSSCGFGGWLWPIIGRGISYRG